MDIKTAEEFFEQSGTYPELAIKFAKLHVQKALQEASEKADYHFKNFPCTGLNRTTILNAYNLDNIK